MQTSNIKDHEWVASYCKCGVCDYHPGIIIALLVRPAWFGRVQEASVETATPSLQTVHLRSFVLGDTVQLHLSKELRQCKTMACSFCLTELATPVLHLKSDDNNLLPCPPLSPPNNTHATTGS